MFVLNGNGEKVLNAMKRIGLGRYEARAYFTLLLCGELKAGTIARLSAVPQGKIYPTMEGLEEKGIVEVSYCMPKRYRAKVPLRNIVRSYVQSRREDIRYAREARAWLGNIIKNISPIAKKYEDKRIRIFEPSYMRG